MNEHSFSEGSGSGVLLVVAVKIIVEKFTKIPLGGATLQTSQTILFDLH